MGYVNRRAGRYHRISRLLALSLVVAILGCTATSSLSRDDVPAGAVFDEVTLASLNVENFFDNHNDPYTEDEGTAPKTEKAMAALAGVISRMNADFVGVVEMETQGLLWSFKNQYLPDGGYDDVFVGHRDYGRGINNGAMSRVPIQTVHNFHFRKLRLPGEERYWRFARDVLAFDIEPRPGVSMRIYVVHLKSKRNSRDDPDSAKWRLSEATEVRRIVEQQLRADRDALFAVIGDFNDTPDSEPVRTLLAPDAGGKPVLVDVHAGLPAEQRVTYLRPPYRSTIDYILVSPAMAKLLVPGSAKVLNDAAVLEATDHGAVMATFRLPATP